MKDMSLPQLTHQALVDFGNVRWTVYYCLSRLRPHSGGRAAREDSGTTLVGLVAPSNFRMFTAACRLGRNLNMLAACILIAAFAAVVVSGLEAPIPGYSVFTPEWEVQVTPGGESVHMNGTIEHIFDELANVNPVYTEALMKDFTALGHDRPGALERREDWRTRPFICRNHPSAKVDAAWDGIRYLRTLKSKPKSSAGPASCGQISCSWNTAIWWCNDKAVNKELESYRVIADGAQYMWEACTPRGNSRYWSSGQIFSNDGWNIIIKKSESHC
ncbi:hypothetical protein CTA2_4233 [Colletotrichum tanaceti]|uniref:Uncharacterized protein n=1 Tax=Colletotrichum tanaceti TaxID=1306861 RepID=A0A4U6XCI3_9PEZI|nr:hypothetical protein CTA2_4233 [Colletotrichum tanaceti]TKW53305.1 hypothetical protein CTA1_2365 [Colletotrichum tanaceti]